MRIVSMCGSLGATSVNRIVLDLATERVQLLGGVERVVDVPLREVPMFDPALVDDPPEAVATARMLVASADGLMIGAPEYAGGLAGGIKNALDWLVGSSSLYHRPVAVLSAGTTGGAFALDQLVRTLSWQGALTVAALGIDAPRAKLGEGVGFADVETVRAIEQWADHLVAAVAMPPDQLLARVTDVVGPFGVDPARFGDLT